MHLLKALNRWPKDALRPTVQLQEVLRKRLERKDSALSSQEGLQQANALYSLLDNRYRKKVGTVEDNGSRRYISTDR